jgi:hypothetical protein
MAKKVLKKHSFHHKDPESTNSTSEKEVHPATHGDNTTKVAIKDFKKVIITILAFILILAVYYFVQTKTGFLKPVLKFFNI